MPGGDVLVLIDEAGRVVEWGREAEELFGWASVEAVGLSVTQLLREAAVGGAAGRGPLAGMAGVLVKPVLRGTSVVWQVLAAQDSRSQLDVAILATLFAQPREGLLVLDDQLRVLRASTAAARLRDVPVERFLGRHYTEVYELENPEEEAAVARGVLGNGVPVVDRLARGAAPPGHLRHRVHSFSYFRLEDPRGGRVLGLVASQIDVTQSETAKAHLALLDMVRTRVVAREDVGAVGEELVDVVVPAFAGAAVVDVIENVFRGEEALKVPVRPGVRLRRAAFRGPIEAYPVGEVTPLPAGTPFSQVLADLRPRLLAIDEGSAWLAADPVRANVIRRCGARSMIVAPLALHGRTLGVITLYRHQDQDPFDEADLAIMPAVCARVALCIDHARRNMREKAIALTVQSKLLPQQPASQSTVEISHLRITGPEGGGAWYDTIALPGARTALIVGDVPGRGITKAITMGLLRTALNTLAALDLEPDELLARLNDATTRLAATYSTTPPLDHANNQPITAGCIVAIYDPIALTCTVARAGLPDPVVILPDGMPAGFEAPAGPTLAGEGNAPFPASTVHLPEGSTLAMGTTVLADEVLAPSGPLYPLLTGACTRALPDLRDAIAHARGDRGGADESLMLLARTKALPEDRVLTVPLPSDTEAAPIARAAARRRLELWGVDEETAVTTELIVSELVGNAVRYGTPPLQLRLIYERMLTCEVSDRAATAPHVKHARTIDETGRGLFIVASLADQWGTRYHAQGKTVWAEQETGTQDGSGSR